MMRAVPFDMVDRGLDIVDDFDGNYGVEVLGTPIFFGYRFDPFVDGQCRLVAADFAAGRDEHFNQRLELAASAGAVDQERFGGTADAGTPHFRIEHDFLGHLEGGRLVDVDMADTFEVREYRHACFRLHPRHEVFAAPRHDHVDIAVEAGQHEAHRRAVTSRHKLDRRLRQ